MKSSTIILSGSAAIALMTFYFFIPFQIVARVPDWLERLRPFVLSASVTLIAFGFYRLRREVRLKSQVTTPARFMFLLSAMVVLGMRLSPHLLANFLANLLAD